MLKQEELIRTPEYWLETIQNTLYEQVKSYMDKKGINQTELANELGVTKGYISQVLRGNFNYTISKLIDLSLAIGVAPDLEFKSFDEYLKKEYGKISSGAILIENTPFTVAKGSSKTITTSLHSQFSLKVTSETGHTATNHKIA